MDPGQGVSSMMLPEAAADQIREHLPRVADMVVGAIIAEVPSYEDALGGRMGGTIRTTVQLALGGFLSLAGGKHGSDPRTPTAPAVQGAYQLGRGEARSGRSTDALLSAYRIGARVSWREMSGVAVRGGIDADTLASFAELVFAYIDELSASSVAGHTDELASSGRVRQQRRDRLAQHLLDGATPEQLTEDAERAEWVPPTTLTALLLPVAQVRPSLTTLPAATLVVSEPPGLEEVSVLLVPDIHGSVRASLLRRLEARDVVAGPARAWTDVRRSVERARRARLLDLPGDTEEHLAELVLHADADALGDLRAQVLAPLGELKPAAAEKLEATLRSWLLLQGRREEVAAALFVHAQTVRYRMTQLRELYGEALDDPDTVLRLVLALGPDPRGSAP